MSAIRLARAATGRDIIVKFEGCYHGHSDGLLVKAGSGVATFGIPGSAGVPDADRASYPRSALQRHRRRRSRFRRPPWRDRRHHHRAHRRQRRLYSSCPRLPRRPARSHYARRRSAHRRRSYDRLPSRTRRCLRALLTRSRPHHPRQNYWRWTPRRRLRRQAEVHGSARPSRPRLSGRNAQRQSSGNGRRHRHPHLPPGQRRPDLPAARSHLQSLFEGVAAEAAIAGIPLTTNRVGAMGTWFFTPGPVTNYDEAAKSDTALFGRFHNAMLNQGIWLPPSQFEAAFLSTAHGDAEIQATITAAAKAFQSI